MRFLVCRGMSASAGIERLQRSIADELSWLTDNEIVYLINLDWQPLNQEYKFSLEIVSDSDAALFMLRFPASIGHLLDETEEPAS